MLNNGLARYIKEKLAAGYHLNVIRDYLIRWGYNPQDVGDTIGSLYPYASPFGEAEKRNLPSSETFNFEESAVKGGKENNFANLFLRPGRFFGNPDNSSLKKSLSYTGFSLLAVFLAQTASVVWKEFYGGNNMGRVFAAVLTQFSMFILFVLFLAVFFVILVAAYFILFKDVFHIDASFSSLSAILLLSLLPYVLVSSLSNTPVYGIITILNVSIGFFDLNPFLLWSLALFSLGLSINFGISLKKSLLIVFAPFALAAFILLFVFYDIIRIEFLWMAYEKF